MFDISDFSARGLPLGGARPSYFQVTLDTPTGVPNIIDKIAFTCHAAAIPDSSLVQTPVPYFGRQIKLAGSRQIANWQIQVYNDESFDVRHALELWSNAINSHKRNLRDPSLLLNSAYRTTARVIQYSKAGMTVLRVYRAENVWPVRVGQIDLQWSDEGAVEVFPVELSLDWWDVDVEGVTGTLPV